MSQSLSTEGCVLQACCHSVDITSVLPPIYLPTPAVGTAVVYLLHIFSFIDEHLLVPGALEMCGSMFFRGRLACLFT